MTASSKHSGLPWRVVVNKDGTRLVGVGDKDGMGVLDCGFGVWSWDHPEGIANAELVVRSVNSLPALVAALEEIAGTNGLPSSTPISVARRALAAAKGEES